MFSFGDPVGPTCSNITEMKAGPPVGQQDPTAGCSRVAECLSQKLPKHHFGPSTGKVYDFLLEFRRSMGLVETPVEL